MTGASHSVLLGLQRILSLVVLPVPSCSSSVQLLLVIVRVVYEQMQRARPEGCLERPIGRGCMQHPLESTAPGVRQMDLAGTLQGNTRRNPCDGRLDRIELKLGVG